MDVVDSDREDNIVEDVAEDIAEDIIGCFSLPMLLSRCVRLLSLSRPLSLSRSRRKKLFLFSAVPILPSFKLFSDDCSIVERPNDANGTPK